MMLKTLKVYCQTGVEDPDVWDRMESEFNAAIAERDALIACRDNLLRGMEVEHVDEFIARAKPGDYLALAKRICERTKELRVERDRLKMQLEQQKPYLLPSELCDRDGVQCCHCCDRIECDDNTSPSKQRIAELEAKLLDCEMSANAHIIANREQEQRLIRQDYLLANANKRIAELENENLRLKRSEDYSVGVIERAHARMAELQEAEAAVERCREVVKELFRLGFVSQAALLLRALSPAPANDLKEHCEWAAEEVAKMPKWKQTVLGGAPTTYSGQCKHGRAMGMPCKECGRPQSGDWRK